MVLVLFMPSCTGAGEQKYWKKQWELNDFILFLSFLRTTFPGFLPSCPGGGHEIFYCKYWCLSSRPPFLSRWDESKCHQVLFFLIKMSARAASDLHGYLITLRQDPFSASTVWGIFRIEIRSAQNVGKVLVRREENIPGLFGALVDHFFPWAYKNTTFTELFAYFPWWSNRVIVIRSAVMT